MQKWQHVLRNCIVGNEDLGIDGSGICKKIVVEKTYVC